jgi:hypothetical protein
MTDTTITVSPVTVTVGLLIPESGETEIVNVPVGRDGINPDPIALKQALYALGYEAQGELIPRSVFAGADYIAFVETEEERNERLLGDASDKKKD